MKPYPKTKVEDKLKATILRLRRIHSSDIPIKAKLQIASAGKALMKALKIIKEDRK